MNSLLLPTLNADHVLFWRRARSPVEVPTDGGTIPSTIPAPSCDTNVNCTPVQIVAVGAMMPGKAAPTMWGTSSLRTMGTAAVPSSEPGTPPASDQSRTVIVPEYAPGNAKLRRTPTSTRWMTPPAPVESIVSSAYSSSEKIELCHEFVEMLS